MKVVVIILIVFVLIIKQNVFGIIPMKKRKITNDHMVDVDNVMTIYIPHIYPL